MQLPTVLFVAKLGEDHHEADFDLSEDRWYWQRGHVRGPSNILSRLALIVWASGGCAVLRRTSWMVTYAAKDIHRTRRRHHWSKASNRLLDFAVLSLISKQYSKTRWTEILQPTVAFSLTETLTSARCSCWETSCNLRRSHSPTAYRYPHHILHYQFGDRDARLIRLASTLLHRTGDGCCGHGSQILGSWFCPGWFQAHVNKLMLIIF